MKPANAIRSDGSINPDAYDIVDGCHIWKLSLIGGRPVTATDGRKTFIREWVTQTEAGRRIRATCHNHRCINAEHLVVEPTVYATTAALLARVPHGALRAYDRDLLERRARGETCRIIAADLGLPETRVSNQLTIASMRLHLVIVTLDRKSSDADLASLPQEIDETPGERELG